MNVPSLLLLSIGLLMSLPQVYGRILHDIVYTYGASRHIQYNTDTGELFIIGEQGHGLDYYGGCNGFWSCGLGEVDSSPLLSFILWEWNVKHSKDADYLPPGVSDDCFNDKVYSVMRVDPLASQKTFVNRGLNQTVWPGDYREIDNSNLEFFLYQRVDQKFEIAVMGKDITDLLSEGEAQGSNGKHDDGVLDNGVRIHIAFRAVLDLPSELFDWTATLDEYSTPYEALRHPRSARL